MDTCKVSIIVPVYKVEQYLGQCMDSLVGQTLEEIEIIAVNDGSPDNSLAILQEYRDRDPEKVNVFSIENQGVSHARNYGVSKAKGEYLLFVDSDDYLEKNACQKLYEHAKLHDNDLVLFGRYNLREGGETEKLYLPVVEDFSLREYKEEMARLSPFPWDKLIRRELFQEIGGFPEGIRFEDLPVAHMLAVSARKIGVVSECLYHYRVQAGFLNTLTEHTLDIVTALKILVNFLKDKGLYQEYHQEVEYICVRHCCYRFVNLRKFAEKGKLDLQMRLVQLVYDFLESEFPKWRENPYVRRKMAVGMKHFLFVCERPKLMMKFVQKTDGKSILRKKLWVWVRYFPYLLRN